MENTYKKRKNLFLQQSYRDSWEDYERIFFCSSPTGIPGKIMREA